MTIINLEKFRKSDFENTQQPKTILYFGTYEESYCRNQIMIKSLKQIGHTVKECHIPLWENKIDKLKTFDNIYNKISFMLKLLKVYMFLFIRYLFIGHYDIIFIGYIGHLDILFARIFMLITLRKKKIVFDAFISLYDSIVSDRKIIAEKSFISKLAFCIDKIACDCADIVILDTNAHIDYFNKTFRISKDKMIRIFASADEDVFYKRKIGKKNNRFNVLFIGKYTPLHGVEYIVEAAEILKKNQDIHFTFIGRGQLYPKIRSIVKDRHIDNIKFIEWVEYEMLPNYIETADICLGIFSASEKASRVIPNKVFQSMAMGKVLITAKTLATAEGLRDGDNAILCNPADPIDLSNAIIKVKEDILLSKKLAFNAKQTFLQNFGRKEIIAGLHRTLKFTCNMHS
ncbi:MAG: glycosyltransferase [Desulfobacterales bacterium]|jgi:glycosyltransferase involved in cell wall biosynthesis